MWCDSDDAENDADRTVREIVSELDTMSKARVPKALLESALYCCNMEDEKGKVLASVRVEFHGVL
jgi:hypothetical protein